MKKGFNKEELIKVMKKKRIKMKKKRIKMKKKRIKMKKKRKKISLISLLITVFALIIFPLYFPLLFKIASILREIF